MTRDRCTSTDSMPLKRRRDRWLSSQAHSGENDAPLPITRSRSPSSVARTTSAWISSSVTGSARWFGSQRTGDRKRVGWGKSVSVRVDVGGGRLIKKKNNKNIV